MLRIVYILLALAGAGLTQVQAETPPNFPPVGNIEVPNYSPLLAQMAPCVRGAPIGGRTCTCVNGRQERRTFPQPCWDYRSATGSCGMQCGSCGSVCAENPF